MRLLEFFQLDEAPPKKKEPEITPDMITVYRPLRAVKQDIATKFFDQIGVRLKAGRPEKLSAVVKVKFEFPGSLGPKWTTSPQLAVKLASSEEARDNAISNNITFDIIYVCKASPKVFSTPPSNGIVTIGGKVIVTHVVYNRSGYDGETELAQLLKNV